MYYRYLEEKNIALFLSIVETEIRKSNIFSPCKEKIFRHFENFNIVLREAFKVEKNVSSEGGEPF